MSQQGISSALTQAVARMEQNMGTARPGTAVAVPQQARPTLCLGVREDTGEIALPPVPWVPPAAEPLQRAMKLAATSYEPDPVRDEAGMVVWRPVRSTSALTASPEVRRQAAEHAAAYDLALSPLAEREVIEEWLRVWAPHCRRQAGVDYAEREAAIMRAVIGMPGIAFNDDTVALAAQTHNWLPTAAEVTDLLNGWLAPWRQAQIAARQVANARDPEPKAQERPANAPLTEAEVAERRAAVARTMERHRADLNELRANGRVFGVGRDDARPKASVLTDLQLLPTFIQQVQENASTAATARQRIRNTLAAMRSHLQAVIRQGGKEAMRAEDQLQEIEARSLAHPILAPLWNLGAANDDTRGATRRQG